MEDITNIITIAGTKYVRIPAGFSRFLKLNTVDNDNIKISDMTSNSIKVIFPQKG